MRAMIERLGVPEIIILGIGLGLLALLLLAWMLSAIAAGLYANRLNRSGGWGFLALIVSPIPVFLLLFGLGPRTDEDDDHLSIACPFCAEEIKPEAILCPHCHSDLAGTATDRLRAR
jgi:hypothetical protein